jgi:tetratricopeptide (TPR) repeat protein
MRRFTTTRTSGTEITQRLTRPWVVALCLFACIHPTDIRAQTADTYRQRATELSKAKSWDDAITNYRKALDLEPNDAGTHYNLALALKYKGDDREALKEFQAAIKLRPKWAEAHYALGATWYDLQNQSEAVSELRIAESLDPAHAATHRLLARIFSQQSNSHDAELELKRALQTKPSADIHLELGVVEGQLGNLNEAAAQFRRAIQMDSRLASAHLMLGIVLRRQAAAS